MKKISTWLVEKNGFWYTIFIWLIDKFHRSLSLGHHFNEFQNNRNAEGRWVSEFYQFIWVSSAVVWLFFIEQPILTGNYWRYLGIIIALYRPLELSIYILDWLFVKERKEVKSYTRSLAGFLLKMIEIGLFFAIAYIIFNSTDPNLSIFSIVKSNVIAVFKLKQMAGLADTYLISTLSDIQIVISWFLYVVILANVVGGIKQGEEADYKQGKG